MTDGLAGPLDLAVLFTDSLTVLENGIRELATRLVSCMALWVAWPKKSSGVAIDLDRPEVHLQRQGPAGSRNWR